MSEIPQTLPLHARGLEQYVRPPRCRPRRRKAVCCRLLLLRSPPRQRQTVARNRPPTFDLLGPCRRTPKPSSSPSICRRRLTSFGPVPSCLPTSRAPLARRHSALPPLIPVSLPFSFCLELSVDLCFLHILVCTAVYFSYNIILSFNSIHLSVV